MTKACFSTLRSWLPLRGISRLALGIAFSCIVSTAWADYSVEFLRIACIPEANYFSVEYKPLSGSDVFPSGNFDRRVSLDRLKMWKKHGYFTPANLHYECKLAGASYILTSSQPPASDKGMCGGAPRISLSLRRNSDLWLDSVVFGEDCFGGATTNRFEVFDSRSVSLCFSPPNSSQSVCESLFHLDDAIPQVTPLTQSDVEGFFDQRAKASNEVRRPGEAVPPRALSLQEFKKGVCGFEGFRFPEKFEVDVIGDGEFTEKLGPQIDQSGVLAKRINVSVNRAGKRVVLLLGAADPVIWNIAWTPGTTVLAALASGHHRQVVSGLPKGTPLLLSSFSAKHGPCKPLHVGLSLNRGDKRIVNRDEIDAFALSITGRKADRVSIPNRHGQVFIGDPVYTDKEVLTSPDTPPDSFANSTLPLAGDLALMDAIQQGLIRKTTRGDIEIWKALKPPIALMWDTSSEIKPRGFWKSYVVMKAFKFPAGMDRIGFTSFYVPKGVPRVEGNQGSATVIYLDTMQCSGPFCVPPSAPAR
ncbi:MAG TPA: hypothetical protein VI279_14570 [Rhodocyclaceae bacterium]